MSAIVECVPNFSEGRDTSIIKQITDAISSVAEVELLDVDMGYDTNRTVVTFVGPPEPVLEAAFRAMQKAQSVIDMRLHKGEHPRFGATDVCPLIPVSGITMTETVLLAEKLAQRVGSELNYPIWLYESAATKPDRKNLANVRAGEYEGLLEKLSNPDWKPDFGPSKFVPETGATAIGARDFLVAVNFNLNTTSTRRANAVAFDVREAGRETKTTNPETGETTIVRQPGMLKACKAIGWYIAEYGVAQVSMNLTNIAVTSVHEAFEAVSHSSANRGMRVTGTEIVGLVPLKVLTEAGKFYLEKQQRSVGVSEAELIKIAVKSMGLDELRPFEASKKVIEYFLERPENSKLINLNLASFSEETASESAAPGGGSVSAYLGVLGVSLGTMVANLSAHKRGWDDKWKYFSEIADKGESLRRKLLKLVDADTVAFNGIMVAYNLPKKTEVEREYRQNQINLATKTAIEIPFQVIELCFDAFELLTAMVLNGNPNSVTDAGVGAIAIRSAILGASLNVRVNAKGFANETWISGILQQTTWFENEAQKREKEILNLVNQSLLKPE